jgi:hypothetical protein
MNYTIKILDAYNNYQNKIFKKINKLNKDLTILNNVQNTIFTPLQTGGSTYENLNTFPKLQLNLELLKYLVSYDEIDQAQVLLQSTAQKTKQLTQSTDKLSSKMKIINDSANEVVAKALEYKKKEIQMNSIIKKNGSELDRSVVELQQHEFIHPLLESSDVNSFKNILKSLFELRKETSKDTVKIFVNNINDSYKKLYTNITTKEKNLQYHPYSGIAEDIIKDINSVLTNYLDIYFNKGSDTKRILSGVELIFTWDNITILNSLKSAPLSASAIQLQTIAQDKASNIDQLTATSSGFSRPQSRPPPPP